MPLCPGLCETEETDRVEKNMPNSNLPLRYLSLDEMRRCLTETGSELAADGTWEICVHLAEPEKIFTSLVSVPFAYRKLDESLVAYIVDRLSDLPDDTKFRLIFYLPQDFLETLGPERIHMLLEDYWGDRVRLRRKEEKAALHDFFRAVFWGFVFMLACQIVRWLCQFPSLPTLTQTVSEGLLVLGWVALWNPYDSFFFSWLPARKKRLRIEKLSTVEVRLRAYDFEHLRPIETDASDDAPRSTALPS